MKKCPGSISFRQPKPETVKCPACCTEVEIWTDEAAATCPKCANTVTRNSGQSCLDWCKHARECLGDDKFRKYLQMKADAR